MADDSPPAPLTTPPPAPRRRRKVGLLMLLLVLVGVPICLGVTFYWQREKAEQALLAAEATADHGDPGWRLEDIESRRLALPMKDNAATQIQKAANSLPDPWPIQDEFRELENLWPQIQLDAATAAAIRKQILPLRRTVMGPARAAMKYQKGWFLVEWTPDYVGTPHPHLDKVRNLGMFLALDAVLRAHDGDQDGAWDSSLNLLTLSRAIGEEPDLIAHLLRCHLRAMAVGTLQRVLAQGTVKEPALAAAQKALTAEGEDPILIYGLRGERAGLHLLFCNLEAGTLDAKTALAVVNPDADVEAVRTYLKGPGFLLGGNTYKRDHAWALEFCNALVELAKGPLWEFEAAAAARRKSPAGPPFGDAVCGWVPRVAPRFVTAQAQLDCAVAGLAVERYRLQVGCWPDSLDQLVAAGLLAKIPPDPFDGKPLRYRKTRDGAVVYSVGPFKNYLGDALDADPETGPPPARYEFRVWAPDSRRRVNEMR